MVPGSKELKSDKPVKYEKFNGQNESKEATRTGSKPTRGDDKQVHDFSEDNTVDNERYSDNTSENKYESERVPIFSWSKLWMYTGPGWLMSIAYLDPGNIEGDLLAGTHGGYGLIWTLALATFCGLVIQILSIRIGVVTGRDLAVLCRQQFSKPLAYILWVMTEIAIIGSDIQEVIGTAIAFKILFGFPIWLGAIITILDTFTFLFIHACGVRKLEAFFAVLVGTMAICFWANMFIVRPNAGDVMGGFLPQIPKNSMDEMIGLIGAVIMPHNLFLHSALVLSRKVDNKNEAKVREANKYFSIEAAFSLFVSLLINIAVISTFAYYHLKDGSEDIFLENAHKSLEKSFGTSAKLVWAIGLMAAGQSSTMTGTYAGQFVMQGFISLKIPVYLRVLITRSIAIVPAILVAFVANLDRFDGYLNILQAVQLPFALIPLLKFSASTRVMSGYKNSLLINIFCISVSIILIGLNLYGLIPNTKNGWVIALVVILAVLYFGILIAVLISPVKELEPLEEQNEGHSLTTGDEGDQRNLEAKHPESMALLNKSNSVMTSNFSGNDL